MDPRGEPEQLELDLEGSGDAVSAAAHGGTP